MTNHIHVQPHRGQRVAFARWAVSQRPKVRTVTAEAFAVPARLFTDMPEDLLRGSLVDGRPYVSPLDHEETEAAGPGAPELVGVATLDGLRVAAPGQPLPEVPPEAYGPDAVPLPPPEFAPLEDAPGGELVLVGEDGPETVVPLGDTSGDTRPPGGDTAGETPAVASGDTPGDTGDTSEDTAGDKPYGCDRCPRTFTTERGRATHRAMVHGR